MVRDADARLVAVKIGRLLAKLVARVLVRLVRDLAEPLARPVLVADAKLSLTVAHGRGEHMN